MNELALFAGAGGGILGGHLLGWRTVCAVEWEPYAVAVLSARQNEGILPAFPIWDDVQTFDGTAWRGRVDVVSGGFPCQDISSAGKGAGIDGERSGMWSHMARIIREVGPRFVFVENSSMLTSRGLGRVLGDLAALGYDARWGVVGAVNAGAPHKRYRIWIVGHMADSAKLFGDGCDDNARISAREKPLSELGDSGGPQDFADAKGISKRKPTDETDSFSDSRNSRLEPVRCGECEGQNLADSYLSQREGMRCTSRSDLEHSDALPSSSWWRQDPAEASEPSVGRMADGVAARVDRLKAIGNGQVPAVAALAWRILSK